MMRWTIAAALLWAMLSGCNSDEDKVEKVGEWLCHYGQLEEPQEMGLPEDEQLSKYVRSEDLAFLEGQRSETEGESGAFGGLAKAFEAAMTPAARAVVESRAKHTDCEVSSVEVDGDTATATIRQTTPKLGDANPFSRLQELGDVDTHEERVERVDGWFEEASERTTEEHTLNFVKTADGWRASYGLAERAEEERRIEIAAEISNLEAQLEDLEEAREGLAAFEIVDSRFEKVQRRFRDRALIHLTVKNGTDAAISRAYFHGRLVTPGRQIPWVDEDFNYEIPGGLEPGEQVEWSLEPSIVSDWVRVDAPQDAVFEVELVQLDGAGGDPLYTVRGVSADELRGRIAELRAGMEAPGGE